MQFGDYKVRPYRFAMFLFLSGASLYIVARTDLIAFAVKPIAIAALCGFFMYITKAVQSSTE